MIIVEIQKENLLYGPTGQPIAKSQIYTLLVDENGAPVLDVDGAQQVVALQSTNGKLQVDASINGSLAKPQHTCTRPNDTIAYSAGDVVGEIPAMDMIFENVIAQAGGQFIITGVTLEIDVASIPAGMTGFRLHIFDADPTAIADNVTWVLADADRAKYLGYIDIETPIDLGGTLWSQTFNINFPGKLASGSTTLYVQKTTNSAFTPTALTVKKLTLHTLGV